MGSFERFARVGTFFALLVVFSVGFELAARVGGLWLTREGSAEVRPLAGSVKDRQCEEVVG